MGEKNKQWQGGTKKGGCLNCVELRKNNVRITQGSVCCVMIGWVQVDPAFFKYICFIQIL